MVKEVKYFWHNTFHWKCKFAQSHNPVTFAWRQWARLYRYLVVWRATVHLNHSQTLYSSCILSSCVETHRPHQPHILNHSQTLYFGFIVGPTVHLNHSQTRSIL